MRKGIYLPPCARRLRHLQGIFARHLPATDGALPSTYFKLYRGDGENGDDDLLFCSNMVMDTVNPAWEPLPQTLRGGLKLQDITFTQFVVIVYNSRDEELVRCYVELRKVVNLCQFMRQVKPASEATVFFEFNDGIFISSSPTSPHPLNDIPLSTAASPTSEVVREYEVCTFEVETRKDVDMTTPMTLPDVQYNVTRLVTLSYALEAGEENVVAARTRIADRLSTYQRRRELSNRVDRERLRVAELRQQLADSKMKLAITKETVRTAREEIRAEAEEIKKASKAFDKADERRDQLAHKKSLKAQLERIRPLMSARRYQLVAGLQEIFPIEKDKVSEALTVGGMHLFRDGVATDDEAATALGYVTHCVRLLSWIWGVPLRYAVSPIASRSYIHEQTIEPGKPEAHPLFCTRGSDKVRYFQSICLLNKNLSQLLQMQGMGLRNSRYMLLNLQELLYRDPCNEGFLLSDRED